MKRTARESFDPEAGPSIGRDLPSAGYTGVWGRHFVDAYAETMR